MVLVGEGLDDALHQVLLCEGVLAGDHDFEDARQHDLLVDVVGDTLKARKSDDVFAHGHSELVTLNLALLLVLVRRQVLQTHPETIHLTHVLQNEFD